MELPRDYTTLRLIWWGLLGVLLIAFALTDGFDLGVGALLPFVAKTDEERRMVINTVGATWEGNQVWFIVGGAAIFAAWPFVYAVSFSGFYLAMFLVLSALILRPVSFKYRSKRPSPKWRSFWDWCLFIGGFVPALVFGVAVGNVLLGAPFRLDSDLRSFYDGNLLGLFTPFSLIAGLLSVAMLVLHGAAWLSVKAEQGPVLERARLFGTIAGLLALVLFAAGGLYMAFGNVGYPNVPCDHFGVSTIGTPTRTKSYTVYDASLTYDLGMSAFRLKGVKLALNVKNLTDKEYVASCRSEWDCYYGDGRTVVSSLSYDW